MACPRPSTIRRWWSSTRRVGAATLPPRRAASSPVAGEVDVIVGTPPVITPYLPDKRLIALCVTSPERYSVLPDIPSSAEAGLAKLSVQHWFGLWAPAGLPANVREKLFNAAALVLRKPDVQGKLALQGMVASPSSSIADFDQFVRREVPLWKQRVLDSGASAD